MNSRTGPSMASEPTLTLYFTAAHANHVPTRLCTLDSTCSERLPQAKDKAEKSPTGLTDGACGLPRRDDSR
ncbi:hypothetical protein [Comamonas sp. lk]|uniref:hypothetical protein n=1 Tax=Comamonas sp. lk TaxID=2201272 RepID=UPI0013CE4585|nr:hypothetical protein [Comamonas sp. lk]